MDAEIDEDVELLSPPSVVMESARSRVDNDDDDDDDDDEGMGCASGFTAGTEVETESVASCLLMPFCACET